MAIMRSKAFAPGHISGFFQICRNSRNLEKYGSRGAGICINKGVTSAVEIKESDAQAISVFINGKESAAEVTKQAIKNLLSAGSAYNKKTKQKGTKTQPPDSKYSITINTALELPVSQGFGLSAAGALSAALATAYALELKYPKTEAVSAAHKAEIACGTGLGDVVAEATGGVVFRREPGIPPHGVVDRIDSDSDVVLCVVGEEILTKDIILNAKHIKRINDSGERCMIEFLADPTIANFFEVAYKFTLEIKLMSSSVINAINEARKYGAASACMLGNSVFAMGDVDKMTNVLKEYGEVYLCEIDMDGMRVLT